MSTPTSDVIETEMISSSHISKQCVRCQAFKPVAEFRRRSGKRAGANARRGICRSCRELQGQAASEAEPLTLGDMNAVAAALESQVVEPEIEAAPKSTGKRRRRRKKTAAKPQVPQPSVDQTAAAAAVAAPQEAPGGAPAAPKGKRRRRRRGKGAQALLAAAPVAAPLAQAPAASAAPAGVGRAAATLPFRMSGSTPQAAAPAAAVQPREVLPAAAVPAGRAPAARAAAAAPRAQSRAARPQAATQISAAGRVPAAPQAQAPDRAVARQIDPHDSKALKPTRQGYVRMRGRTDKGRNWYQEIDLEMAVTLVEERAAVVVNRHTIRRLLSNKDFRTMILERDKYTCYFCGEYGDTIDHMLPRSKGGHTTPENCVCACNFCNQVKANRDMDEFIAAGIPEKPPLEV